MARISAKVRHDTPRSPASRGRRQTGFSVVDMARIVLPGTRGSRGPDEACPVRMKRARWAQDEPVRRGFLGCAPGEAHQAVDGLRALVEGGYQRDADVAAAGVEPAVFASDVA